MSKLKNIKAILFDMGGVLVDLDMAAGKKNFNEVLEYPDTETMLDPCHGQGLFMKTEAGELSGEEFRKAILAQSKAGCTEYMVNEAMWSMLVGIRPEKARLLKRLSQKYDLYLLSNNNPIMMVKCRRLFEEAGIPLEKIFKKSFVSCEMKLIKPCREIFERVIAQIPEHSASEILFIDDSMKNVEVAAQTGLQTLHYQQGEDLEEKLSEVLEF